MDIIRITEITNEVVAAFGKLIAQLTGGERVPTKMDLEDIVFQPSSYLLGARENGEIVGTLTLIIYKIPSGRKAWIEDVVVDAGENGKGIGRQLVLFAVDYARKLGLSQIDLTSKPDRVAANELYKKLGFAERESNVYRMNL